MTVVNLQKRFIFRNIWSSMFVGGSIKRKKMRSCASEERCVFSLLFSYSSENEFKTIPCNHDTTTGCIANNCTKRTKSSSNNRQIVTRVQISLYTTNGRRRWAAWVGTTIVFASCPIVKMSCTCITKPADFIVM